MGDYEVGDHVAYEKLRWNVLAWADGDSGFEEYIQKLMRSECSDADVFRDLQAIGLELGLQGAEEETADSLYEKILDADREEDGLVFGLDQQGAEDAFYNRGYYAARRE